MYYLSFEPGILLNVKSVIFIHVAACDSVAFLVMARRCFVTYTHNTHSPFKNQWIPRLILCWPIVYTANINMGVQMVFDMLISSPPHIYPVVLLYVIRYIFTSVIHMRQYVIFILHFSTHFLSYSPNFPQSTSYCILRVCIVNTFITYTLI